MNVASSRSLTTLIKVYMPHKGANDPENYDADVLFNNYGGSNVSLRPITEAGYQALLGANIGIRKGGPDQKGDYPAGRDGPVQEHADAAAAALLGALATGGAGMMITIFTPTAPYRHQRVARFTVFPIAIMISAAALITMLNLSYSGPEMAADLIRDTREREPPTTATG